MKFVFPPLLLWLFSPMVLGQVTLEYKLEKGNTFLIQQEARQTIVQELDGATHELINYIDGMLEFKVLGEKEGHYEIALTFKDLNLRMNSSIQGELMNVAAKEIVEGDMQTKIFNSLLNYPVRMTLAKNGDILGVIGGDSLVSKMAEASGLEDEFSLNMMKRSLEKEFGSEALSNSYEQLTYFYPSEEVLPGDIWSNAFSGKLSSKNTWKLEAIENDRVEISGSAEVDMDITEPATTMNLTGTQNTKIIADPKTGFIYEMRVEGVSHGTGTMTQMGAQEIPTTIQSTITYKLITE